MPNPAFVLGCQRGVGALRIPCKLSTYGGFRHIIFTINGAYPRTGMSDMQLVSGQLTYVLYPLWSLISTIFNSRPSEELTFHLSYCYFAASAASGMCGILRIHIDVWQMYTAGIDLGQLMHVLYPLCNLICTIFNSRPSGELTFHLSYCYFAASAACDMRKILRIHIGV